MQTKLKKIGNSRGIILPASLIEEYKLDGGVEITAKENYIAISHQAHARAGWNEMFAKAKQDEDGIENQFDQNEWTW